MVHAAAEGMYDFSQFDPEDRWKVRKLEWIISHLQRQQDSKIAEITHQHWLARLLQVFISAKAENGEDYRKSAVAAFRRVLRATLPWESDKIDALDTQTGIESVVDQYHQIYGRPGEERYERMVSELIKEFDRLPKTDAEKRRARFKRRQARELAKKAALEAGATDG